MKESSRTIAGWVAALSATAMLVVLSTLPPYLDAGGRFLLMRIFAPLCHQIAERSPHVNDIPLAVCHRCYGVYWGLFLASAAFIVLRGLDSFLDRRSRWIIPLSLVPAGVDWLGEVAGIWLNTPTSRLLTGGLFGLTAGYYLARAFVDIASSPRDDS